MDLKQELRDLAERGDDASVSLMRDLVMQHPQHANMAFDLLAEIGTDEAGLAIFAVMKEYPGSLGSQGIRALAKTDNPNVFADIYNYVSLVETGPKVKFFHTMEAMDAMHRSSHEDSDKIYSALLDMSEDHPSVRLAVLRERAIEGEDRAIDEIGKVVMLKPHYTAEAMDALVDIRTDKARALYEAIQSGDGYGGDRDTPDVDFLDGTDIDHAPDNDAPSDGPMI